MSCLTNKICLVSTTQTDRCGRSWLFNLIVAEFECKYRVCECSLVVVRHIVYCERFSGYREDISCFTNKMCLVSTIQTDRCGRICFFKTLSLPNLNANIVFVCAASLSSNNCCCKPEREYPSQICEFFQAFFVLFLFCFCFALCFINLFCIFLQAMTVPDFPSTTVKRSVGITSCYRMEYDINMYCSVCVCVCVCA